MKRKVNEIEDIDGNKIVFIHDIRFKGKRSVDWKDVEAYLKQYVGEIYTIEDPRDMVYIGKDLPDEYAHSKYTKILMVVRHAENGKMYLYDIMDIKKETSTLFQS